LARYESLTLWRGVACLLVIFYHSLFTGYGLAFPEGTGVLTGIVDFLRRAWVGVPLFFVISGYCVTASADAVRQYSRPGPNFFWRRFRRIYPPYWIWLGFVTLSVWGVESFVAPGFFEKAFLPNPQGLTGPQWFGNLTLTESWRWHFTGGVECALLSPSWTLCYEEQFYALVGLCLLFCRKYFFQALAGMTALVIGGLFLLPWLGVGTWGLFLDGKWLMFAAGILAYYVLNYAPRASLPWYCIPLGFGILVAAAEPSRLLEPRVNEPNQSYFVAFGFALAVIALRNSDARLLLAWFAPPLKFCGERCYSLYLVHWPVVTVVGWAFNQIGFRNPIAIFLLGLSSCLLVTVTLAWAFHWLVERRFLNSRQDQAAAASWLRRLRQARLVVVRSQVAADSVSGGRRIGGAMVIPPL
jgi:peptidoglycan/LPS O-acetylase OafA/YrhL